VFLAWAEAAELGTLGGMPPTDYRSTGVQAIPSQEDSVMSVEPLSRETEPVNDFETPACIQLDTGDTPVLVGSMIVAARS